MGLSSQHAAFKETRYDLEGANTGGPAIAEFRAMGTGPFRELFDAVDVFSDTPMFGACPQQHNSARTHSRRATPRHVSRPAAQTTLSAWSTT